jgi:hypothetical protein
MRYISDRGNIVENYENDRSIDAFIKWIDIKHGNFVDNTPHMKTAQGGRRRRRRNSRSMRRTRTRSRTRTKYSHSRKNAGWKRKPRNKRNSDRY